MKPTHHSGKRSYVLRDRNGDLSKDWYIESWESNKRVRKYFTINKGKTEEERRTIAQQFIERLRQHHGYLPKSIYFQQALYNALEQDRPYLRKKSYQTYKSKLDQFFRWLGNRRLSTKELQAYFASYRESHSQTGTYDCRRMMMTYFKKAGIGHYLKPIKIRKGYNQPLRYFQPFQCRQLLEYMHQHDQMLWLHCLFIYYTALRPRGRSFGSKCRKW